VEKLVRSGELSQLIHGENIAVRFIADSSTAAAKNTSGKATDYSISSLTVASVSAGF